jgi:hypothetical protein
MPAPQSESVVQDDSIQTPYGATGSVGAVRSWAQAVSAAQGAGVGVVVPVEMIWQVKPLAHSAVVEQFAARARGAASTRAVSAPTEKRTLVRDMRFSVGSR